MGIPVVRRSEMMAVPLLESSINTAVVSFHFAYWSLTYALDVLHPVHRAIEHPGFARPRQPQTPRGARPIIVDFLFLGRGIPTLDDHPQLRTERNTGIRIAVEAMRKPLALKDRTAFRDRILLVLCRVLPLPHDHFLTADFERAFAFGP